MALRRWHLGSLSDRGVGSPDCYPLPTSGPHNGSCQSGYWIKDGGCCFGIDDQTSLSHPLHFGFGADFVTRRQSFLSLACVLAYRVMVLCCRRVRRDAGVRSLRHDQLRLLLLALAAQQHPLRDRALRAPQR